MVGYKNPTLGYALWAVAAALVFIPAVYWIGSVVQERNRLESELQQSEGNVKELGEHKRDLEERLRSAEQERDQLDAEKGQLGERLTELRRDKDVYEETVKRSLLPDPSASYYKDEDIYLFDLARRRALIKDKTFEDCHIRGPAVAAVMFGTDFIDCTFAEGSDHDALIWRPDMSRSGYLGAIGLENCIFRRCNFVTIGLLTKLEYSDEGEGSGQAMSS